MIAPASATEAHRNPPTLHTHEDHLGARSDLEGATIVAMERERERLRAARIEIDRIVHDGETLDLGGRPLAVFHLPGHTPDRAADLVDGVLLPGDAAIIEPLRPHAAAQPVATPPTP